MPPKKVLRVRGSDSKICVNNSNPRVILRPLRADSSGQGRYHYNSLPPTGTLFNKPELSDIKLKVGDNSFYAHRLILCAASDVFARMLGENWAERNSPDLELQEEDECVKVFDRFLYYFYTGRILLNENYVIPLFMLADKYNVQALYDECVKVIENGLKVYVVTKTTSSANADNPEPSTSTGTTREMPSAESLLMSSGSSGYSDSSDSESGSDTGDLSVQINLQSSSMNKSGLSGSVTPHPSNRMPGAAPVSCSTSSSPPTYLVASETFPLQLVMKMLMYCVNERISSAALYNLEARLCKHIMHGNFGVWNDLDQDLLVRMLSDQHFYCSEFVLFQAARSWLTYKSERQTAEILCNILSTIRYPILDAEQLYEVERDDVVQSCSEALQLVQQAIRYQLFRQCPRAQNSETWSGPQFEHRQVKAA